MGLDMPTVLLVGAPKIGKSSAVIRAFGKRAFWICTERGAIAPALDKSINPSGEVPDYIECLSLDAPFNEVFSLAEKACVAATRGKYSVIVIDTLSAIADREYDKIVETHEEIEGYGKASRLLGRRIQRVVNLAMSVNVALVCIAHEREPTTIEGRHLPGGPKLPGKLVESVPSMFSMVLRCAISTDGDGNTRRVFRCDPMNRSYVTGDRYGVVVDGEDMDLRAVMIRAVERAKGRG